MVICLEQGADLHMAQLIPLLLTVSCFSKIQIGFTFLVLAHPGSPGKKAVKRVCVCVCVMTQSRIWRYVSTVAASDVTASSYAGYRPCCIVLILSCRGRYIKMVPLNGIMTSYLCTAPVIQSKNIHSIVCQVLDTNLTYNTGPECR